MNETATDYKKLLTDVLQKQMIILGPTIVLAKARHVDGLDVTDDGQVKGIKGDPHATSIRLLEEFRELSPLLVKKTMKPLLSVVLASYPQQAPATPAPKNETKPETEKQES